MFHRFLLNIWNCSAEASNIIILKVNNFDIKQKRHTIFDLLFYTHSTKQNQRELILTRYSNLLFPEIPHPLQTFGKSKEFEVCDMKLTILKNESRSNDETWFR